MAEVKARGLTVHVQRLGRGPGTVVFVHGLVMDNLSSFYFTLANPVARFADVVLYDLRGHGKSERPPAGYAVPELVQDLDALLDALDVRTPVHLVGNSFGGLLALAFALSHPDRVAGLVLIDAHLHDACWAAEMIATLSLEGEERDRRIAGSFQSWLGRHSQRKRTRLAENAEALVHGTALLRDLQSSPPLDEASLGRVRCPVLALYGERSDVRERGEALARALPDCTLRILPGCTHSVLWEATETVRDEVTAWLSRRVQG
jgi:pimeloyl-ACP methyl ester carboxylesterase